MTVIEDAFRPARNALADVKSSHEIQAAAISVLDESNDWRDIATVREWRARQFARIGAEIQPNYLTIDRPLTFNSGGDYPDFVPELDGGFYVVAAMWVALIMTVGIVIGAALARFGVL